MRIICLRMVYKGEVYNLFFWLNVFYPDTFLYMEELLYYFVKFKNLHTE